MRKHSLIIFGVIAVMVLFPITSSARMQITEEVLPGLDGEVSIKFDSYGIPHVYASTTHDLFMAQGYLHAADRWWQLEWSRHQAMGRLAELMGESLAETDRFIRTIGLNRNSTQDVAAASPEVLAGVEAYTIGVNAFTQGKAPQDLAVEYEYLARMGNTITEVEPWDPVYTFSWGQAMVLDQEQSDLVFELTKSGILEAAGPVAGFLLMPGYPYDQMPLISQPGWKRLASAPGSAELSAVPAIPDIPNLEALEGVGSNSWVVSGSLTNTGKPMLANDPHMGFGAPSLWYEIGLHCDKISEDCPIDLFGYSLPGVPGILIGHNYRIAWGLTNSMLDTMDVYLLELNPDNDLQYKYEGEWLDVDVITEPIQVAGGQTIDFPVYMTRFGPMIHHLIGMEQPMAVRYVASEPTHSLDAVLGINMATNWDEFQTAVYQFDSAGQNIVYADVDGNIGIVSAGRIPLRNKDHDGTAPVDGTTAEFEWQGFVDTAENPRLYNPEQGYIVAANNAFLAPGDFKTTLSVFYDYGYRAARIETMLQESGTVTFDRMVEIQNDNYDASAAIMIPVLGEIAFTDSSLSEWVSWLAEWGYQDNADSGQAALFNAFWLKLMALTFDELPQTPSGHSREAFLISQMVSNPIHPLWKNAALEVREGPVIIEMALSQAVEMVTESLGDDRDAWRWDALHVVTFHHTGFHSLDEGLSPEIDAMLPEIDELFTRSAAVDGGSLAVNRVGWNAGNGSLAVSGTIPAMRMVVDLKDIDNSRFVIGLGQSGDPHSRHYSDMLPLWATGSAPAYQFTPGSVDIATERMLVLRPG